MLRRFILWDYARASWQYDVIVGIILVFIFLTPREWFHDQRRIPRASGITMLSRDKFLIDPKILVGVADDQRVEKLTREIRIQTGEKRLTVIRVEPILDSEGELEDYMAFARP